MNRKKNQKQNTLLQLLRDYRFNSILVRNFAAILLVLAATFLGLTFLVSRKMDQLVEKEVSMTSTESLRKTAERMDTAMNEVTQISAQLLLDNDIMDFLLTDTSDASVNYPETLAAKNKLEQYAGVFEYIDSIYVYSSKSNYIVTEDGGGNIGDFDDLGDWYENLTERLYEPARIISRRKYNSYPYLITYILPVRLTQMHYLGGILVNVDLESIGEFAATEEDETLLIVDDRENVIFSSDEEYRLKKWTQTEIYKVCGQLEDGMKKVESAGKTMAVTSLSSENYDWRYVSLVPFSKYEDYRESLKYFMQGILLLVVLLSVALAVLISLYSYSPVRNILSLLMDPDSYDPDRRGEFRHDETNAIEQNIIHNFYSNNQLREELKEYLNITNQAQITALQAQISPHFLYNTLENIRWRAMELSGGNNDVSESILKLSELLRVSLDNMRQIVPLSEEIENAGIYVDILQLRYENRLTVVWDIPEELMGCQVVKVSLQPLIENAVYHGIKPMRGKGQITIRAFREEKNVCLQVCDNGIGMSGEECRMLNADMQEKYQRTAGHIGVRNVNQRLKLLLGEDAGIRIESSREKGTIVTMTFPFCLYREQPGL